LFAATFSENEQMLNVNNLTRRRVSANRAKGRRKKHDLAPIVIEEERDLREESSATNKKDASP